LCSGIDEIATLNQGRPSKNAKLRVSRSGASELLKQRPRRMALDLASTTS